MDREPMIWVDADATPRTVRELLFRAAERRGVPLCFVANRPVPLARLPHVTMIVVDQGPDVADQHIAAEVAAGDLVITADVPLAAKVVATGAAVLQPNGRELDQRSIDTALAMRDLSQSLRDAGQHTGGPAPLGPRHRQQFANALDRWITRRQQTMR